MYGTRPRALAAELRRITIGLASPDQWRGTGCWIATGSGTACTRSATHVGRFSPGVHVNLCPVHAEIIARYGAEHGSPVAIHSR